MEKSLSKMNKKELYEYCKKSKNENLYLKQENDFLFNKYKRSEDYESIKLYDYYKNLYHKYRELYLEEEENNNKNNNFSFEKRELQNQIEKLAYEVESYEKIINKIKNILL